MTSPRIWRQSVCTECTLTTRSQFVTLTLCSVSFLLIIKYIDVFCYMFLLELVLLTPLYSPSLYRQINIYRKEYSPNSLLLTKVKNYHKFFLSLLCDDHLAVCCVALFECHYENHALHIWISFTISVPVLPHLSLWSVLWALSLTSLYTSSSAGDSLRLTNSYFSRPMSHSYLFSKIPSSC